MYLSVNIHVIIILRIHMHVYIYYAIVFHDILTTRMAFEVRIARLEFVVSLWEKPIMWRYGAWMNQFGRREEFSRVSISSA